MEKFVPVVNRTNCCKVFLSDIVYIQADGRRVKIVTPSQVFYIYAKISDISLYFEGEQRFFQCTQRIVINLDYVFSVRNQTISFINGFEFLIGRTSYLKTKQAFIDYMKQAELK